MCLFLPERNSSHDPACVRCGKRSNPAAAAGSGAKCPPKEKENQRRCADGKRRASLEKADTSRHVPSSTEPSVATSSQFLFSKPLRCTPRPAALTSMSEEEWEWEQWLPCRPGLAPRSVSHAAAAAEGWRSVATLRRMQTAAPPPPQVPSPPFLFPDIWLVHSSPR